jgi:hypothetical protein
VFLYFHFLISINDVVLNYLSIGTLPNVVMCRPSTWCCIDPLLGKDLETNNKYKRCYAVGE